MFYTGCVEITNKPCTPFIYKGVEYHGCALYEKLKVVSYYWCLAEGRTGKWADWEITWNLCGECIDENDSEKFNVSSPTETSSNNPQQDQYSEERNITTLHTNTFRPNVTSNKLHTTVETTKSKFLVLFVVS